MLSILQLIIAIFALIVAAWQLRYLAKQVSIGSQQISEMRRWNQMNATFNYIDEYRHLTSRISLDTRAKINMITLIPGDFNQKFFSEELTEENKNEVYLIIQYFERLSAGIMMNYYDEQIAKEILGKVVTVMYSNLMPYITMRRTQLNTRICQHFEYVAKKWIEELQ